MPRTLQEILDHADQLAARAETAEPDGDGHRAAVAELREAVIGAAEADRRIVQAVTTARADGMSWAAIGIVLGTSGQAARTRYGHTTPVP